ERDGGRQRGESECLQYAEQGVRQPRKDLQSEQPDEEKMKGRFADIKAIVWCHFAEYDEAMNGDDDRRKQQRPDRVLQKTQSFTRKRLIPEALRHKLRRD